MLDSILGHLHAVLVLVLNLYCFATSGKDGITETRFSALPETSNKTTQHNGNILMTTIFHMMDMWLGKTVTPERLKTDKVNLEWPQLSVMYLKHRDGRSGETWPPCKLRWGWRSEEDHGAPLRIHRTEEWRVRTTHIHREFWGLHTAQNSFCSLQSWWEITSCPGHQRESPERLEPVVMLYESQVCVLWSHITA